MISWSKQKYLFMMGCLDSKKKYFFISKLRKNTKKGLKMMIYSNKSHNFLDDPRWVSYISKWAPNYDWFHGKGLILRTLHGALLKLEKLGKKGKKYVPVGIRTHTYWKTQIQSPLLYQLIQRGRLKYVPNIFNLILSKIVPN